MSMQMYACLKKEQIGTLFVRVGAPEGGFRGGGGQGGPPQKVYMPSKKRTPDSLLKIHVLPDIWFWSTLRAS